MRTMLPILTISINHFTWTRNSNGHVGVADESDLPEHLVSRVYTDAADFGFCVAGKTGRVVLFTHRQDLKDNEGDLVARVYESDKMPNVSIHILND